MKRFLILWRLMASNSLAGMNPFQTGSGDKKRILLRILSVAGILVLAGSFLYLEYSLFRLLQRVGQPLVLPALAVLVGMLSCLLMGFFQSMSALYQGKDAPWLAVLPVTSREVYTARLATLWMEESLLNALLFLPALVMYCLGTGLWWPCLATGLVVLLFLPLIPLALVSLVGAALMRVSAFSRHREAVVTGLSMALAVAYSLAVTMFNSRPSEAETLNMLLQLITGKNSLVNLMLNAFPPARWAVDGLTGQVLSLLFFCAVSAACVAAVILLVGGSYLEQALSQTEEAPVAVKKGPVTWKRQGQLRALHSLEWREILRTPAWMFNLLAGTLMVPLMVGIGLVSGFANSPVNSLSEGIRQLREAVDPFYIFLGLVALLSFSCMVNPASATAISREGGRYPFALSLPVPQWKRLTAKLLVGMEINLMSTVPLAIILAVLTRLPWYWFVLALLVVQLIGFPVTAVPLASDALAPKLKWMNETQAVKGNIRSVFGMLIWLGVLSLCGLSVWLLWKHGTVVIGLACGALVLLACLIGWLVFRHAARTACWLPEG